MKLNKARFKRRISHVPNLTRELNACEVRRLNQAQFKRRISHVPNLIAILVD